MFCLKCLSLQGYYIFYYFIDFFLINVHTIIASSTYKISNEQVVPNLAYPTKTILPYHHHIVLNELYDINCLFIFVGAIIYSLPAKCQNV